MKRMEMWWCRNGLRMGLFPRLAVACALCLAASAAQATNFVKETNRQIKVRVPVQLYEACAPNGDCLDMIDDVIKPGLANQWEKIIEKAWNGHSFCGKKVVIKVKFTPMLDPQAGKHQNRVNIYPSSARDKFEWRSSDPTRFDPAGNRVAEWLVDMAPAEVIEQFGRLLGLQKGSLPDGKVTQRQINQIMKQHKLDCKKKEKKAGDGEKRSQACNAETEVYDTALEELESAMARTQTAIQLRFAQLRKLDAYTGKGVLEEVRARHAHMVETLETLIDQAEDADRSKFDEIVKQQGRDPADFGERDFQHYCDSLHNAAIHQLINFYFVVTDDMLSWYVNGAAHEWLFWSKTIKMPPRQLIDEFRFSRYEPAREPPYQFPSRFSAPSSPVANKADHTWYRTSEDARKKLEGKKQACLALNPFDAVQACQKQAGNKYCEVQDRLDVTLAKAVEKRLDKLAKGFDAVAVDQLDRSAKYIADAYAFAGHYINRFRIKDDAPRFDVPGVGRMNMAENLIYMLNRAYEEQLVERHLGEGREHTQLVGSVARFLREQAAWFEDHRTGWTTHLAKGIDNRSGADCTGGQSIRVSELKQDQWQRRRAELYAQLKKKLKPTKMAVDDCAKAVISCYGSNIQELSVFLDNQVASDLLGKVIVQPRRGSEVSNRQVVYIPAEVYEQGWSLDYATEVLLELNIVIDAEDKLGTTPEQLKQQMRNQPENGSNAYETTKKKLRDALDAMGFQQLLDDCLENNGVECDLRG